MSTPSADEPETASAPSSPSRRFRPPSPRMLRGIAAALTLALVVGLLAAVLVHAAGSRPPAAVAPAPTATTSLPTTAPTPTSPVVVPGPQLAWDPASYPGHDTSAAVPV